MSSAHAAEAEDNLRLKRAHEALAHYRLKEGEARRALADAEGSTKRAKEKLDTLFVECEKRACERRKSGQIEVNSGY